MKQEDFRVHPQINKMLDSSNLQKHLAARTITQQKHPDHNLYVYNYSPAVQYTPELWDNETEICRGLIVTGGGEVIARGFRKFFNLNTSFRPETHSAALPASRPQVMEKMDGSLGILYEVNGEAGIATRGSFMSPQAQWATTWYRGMTRHLQSTLAHSVRWPEKFTPLFEIIYNENRIVVKYGFEGLVLIGLVNTATGQEMPHAQVAFWANFNRFECARLYDKSLEEAVAEKGGDNEEGFVLTWFDPYLKVKVKFGDYCRLHKIITGLNAKTVWEMHRDGQQEELKALGDDTSLPTDFRAWLARQRFDLMYSYQTLEYNAEQYFDKAVAEIGDPNDPSLRKAFAIKFMSGDTSYLKAVLFALLDSVPYDHIIWKMLRPAATKPFREDGE